jgi:hypothetical protein
MESELAPELRRLHARARRSYELGRLRQACLFAAALALLVGALGHSLLSARLLPWLPLSFLLWLGLQYRGGAALLGARYGLVAGAITCLLPVSLLRPCCRASSAAMAAPCTMPEMCVLAGALLGLGLAYCLRQAGVGRRLETSAGMLLGVASLAALKCSALFAGEALGLLAGLTAGIVGMSVLSALLQRPRLSA